MAQGTGTPKVNVSVATGNLQRQIPLVDVVAGIVGTAVVAGNIGVVRTVYSYDDAIAKGYTAAAEPFLNGQIANFYNEIGGSMELWIMGVPDTMLFADMVLNTNVNGIKKLLNTAIGRITHVYICRKPAAAYTMPAGFLDVDVSNAVTASKPLCQYQQSINRPVRILIEGRVNNAAFTPIYTPNTASNSYVGVVLGGSTNTGSGTGVLALARVAKYAAHIKLGNGQNGSLTIPQVFIGTKAIADYFPEELDAFVNAGYIIMYQREGLAGYYFGVDYMAGADDFKLLANGSLIDKAQRIATSTTQPFLETSVRMKTDGTINDADAKYMEDLIEQQLKSRMDGQISGVDVLINPNQDLINNATLEIQVKIQPLGYLTWISVIVGLVKSL